MPDSSNDAPLTPLLIDGSGRDGTTLVMQLLGTAAEVAFDRAYPYEQRYFSYLLYWSRLPLREEWDETVWNLDSLAHNEELGERPVVGPVPWLERSLINGNGGKPFWRETFDGVWAAFSQRAREAVRARLGDGDLEIPYYAQKSAESWQLPFDELPEVRLLCLLRDPRDVWVSSVAFHRRRSAEGDRFLPLEADQSEHDLLGQFVDDQKRRLQWLQRVEEERGAAVIRYENLVADLPGQAEEIGGEARVAARRGGGGSAPGRVQRPHHRRQRRGVGRPLASRDEPRGRRPLQPGDGRRAAGARVRGLGRERLHDHRQELHRPRARAGAVVPREHHPDGTCTVLVVDDYEGYLDPAEEPFELIGVDEIGLPDPERDGGALRRHRALHRGEAVAAAAPAGPRAGSRRSTYLDPDILVVDSLAAVDELALEHGVVLTPHFTAPLPRDGRKPAEEDILIAGTYNLGFIALGAGADRRRAARLVVGAARGATA